MKKYIINFLKLAVSLGVGVSLVMWFMGQMSPEEKKNVIDDIKRANYLWVIVPPIIALLSNYFRTERWRILLRPLGYNPGLLNTFLSVMTMYFLNLFFPRLGEVTRCGILARYENVPLDKAIGTMVLERLLDVLCLGIVFLILVVAEHDIFFMLYHKIVSNSKETFGNIIARYQISPDVQHAVLGVVILAIILFIAYQIRKKERKQLLPILRKE